MGEKFFSLIKKDKVKKCLWNYQSKKTKMINLMHKKLWTMARDFLSCKMH